MVPLVQMGYKPCMAGDMQTDYVVLARKYRSRTFGELIGQDALVRTLSNAIAANKIHHAYVLTGIRGTGKTSTARLLAMALNCENGPSVVWDENDPQVESIRTGRHVDVFEFDAASNRGVEDVQKLFEGVNYAPSAGRYKVYIIDEVHMLSTTAFNALLKTLEEPPPRVKFIFATTEVQKIPVTVLSRCQRFDLKRIPSEVLAPYFTEILNREKVQAEPAAVQLIARAADGSVRDGLSLLDQAIALSGGKGIELAVVENMLGVADRARVWDVLEAVMGGKVEQALGMLDDLYAGGTDALGVMQGMLEALHTMTRVKIVPGLAEGTGLTELERRRAVPLAETLGMANMSRAYQLFMQALQEVKVAERPYEALSMAVVRAAYLAPMPGMDKMLEQVKAGGVQDGVPVVDRERELPIVKAGLVGQEKAIKLAEMPQDWKALVGLVRREKPALGASLELQVRCLDLKGTDVRVMVERGMHEAKDLVRDLRQSLKELTGEVWQVVVEEKAAENGAPLTLAEGHVVEAKQKVTEAAEDPMVAEVMGMFPGAELEEVRD